MTNEDKPGHIGRLGTLLGDAGVNIATMALGRDVMGGDAISLVAVDGLVPARSWTGCAPFRPSSRSPCSHSRSHSEHIG